MNHNFNSVYNSAFQTFVGHGPLAHPNKSYGPLRRNIAIISQN